VQTISEIIEQIKEKYSSCISYQDEGFVSTIVEGDIRGRIKYTTLLVPPTILRFEFSDPDWSGGEQKWLLYNPPNVVSNISKCGPDTSLANAIAGLHGVSRGAASLVSTLVFDELKNMLKSTILDIPFHVSVEEIDCIILSSPDGQSLTCGKRDFLIRRAKQLISSDPVMYVEYEITTIKLNEPFETTAFEILKVGKNGRFVD
jgi:hypothetical protein